VIEKIVYNQLQEHLKKHSTLAEERFGFKGDSATSKAIYKLIIFASFKQQISNRSNFFFYLEKALDCLNHDILMSKQWFEPYLNNRYQRTQVLGPLLFLIDINDFPKVVNDKTIPILFVNDTDILVTSLNTKDFHNNMIDAFTFVYNWFKINLLSLYINKTHCVQFKTQNKTKTDINTVCNNRPVTTTSNIKVPWCTYKSFRQLELSF
jgi:hypothetical protein